MKDIDKMLQTASNVELKEFEVPQRVHLRVKYTLKNKEKTKNYNIMKKLVTVLASLIIVFVGSVGVYAVCGGTIEGKPVIEWLGIKFSNEYENYKVSVEGQEISNNETSINLVGTVCDEGFTILEFDVKLSEEDKEKLKIGEPIITDDYLNENDNDSYTREEKEAIKAEYDGKTIDSIYVSFNNKLITDETGTYLESLNNYTVIIDGESFWVRPRSAQTVTRISDYEYKVYQMYFLIDKELGDKKEFTITLNDIVIEANYTQSGSSDVYLPIEGNFEVKVSKEKLLENTHIIEPETEEIKYKDMTKKVEKVINTPLQTIVKVSTLYENVSLTDLSNTNSKDYINMIEYNASNESGEELGTFSYETKRKITYSDGKVEEWEPGDIGTSKNFNNAKMELTEYIIVEKDEENSKIEIEAKELLNNADQKKYNTLGKFEINL